jgi:hypothetical protein
MEPAVLAAHHLPHHEPISFGIDQILSGPEPPGGGLGPGQSGQSHGESAAFSSGFHGASGYAPAGSLASLPRGSGVGPGGVIRVPAHRPLPVPPPSGAAPAVPGPSGLGGAGGLAGLTFPWMDSGRRFAKDRLTGEIALPLGVLPPRPHFFASPFSAPTPLPGYLSPLFIRVDPPRPHSSRSHSREAVRRELLSSGACTPASAVPPCLRRGGAG